MGLVDVVPYTHIVICQWVFFFLKVFESFRHNYATDFDRREQTTPYMSEISIKLHLIS